MTFETTGRVQDTIFALSSGSVPAGIAVIRVSGPSALTVLDTLTIGKRPALRRASVRTIVGAAGDVIDRALVIAFAAPNSSTGEDLVEIHAHGGPALVTALLREIGDQPNCRLAQPGEFTRRAFDMGKLDLTQVEGLADLIAAETEAQRISALSQSSGTLRNSVEEWQAVLVSALADAEAGLDFAEAEEDVASQLALSSKGAVLGVLSQIDAALQDGNRARQLRDGLTIVVSGPPNVGKSSLVNALTGYKTSIVSPRAGTTRDAVFARLDLGGITATLIDTAGLRESDDEIEREGIAQARSYIADADLILSLYCDGDVPDVGVPVQTKSDLHSMAPGQPALAVSSLTGAGVDQLKAWLGDWARTATRPGEPALLMRKRHRALCRQVAGDLGTAIDSADPVLQAESLRLAVRGLGTITGTVGVEALLDVIFAQFCVGK